MRIALSQWANRHRWQDTRSLLHRAKSRSKGTIMSQRSSTIRANTNSRSHEASAYLPLRPSRILETSIKCGCLEARILKPTRRIQTKAVTSSQIMYRKQAPGLFQRTKPICHSRRACRARNISICSSSCTASRRARKICAHSGTICRSCYQTPCSSSRRPMRKIQIRGLRRLG